MKVAIVGAGMAGLAAARSLVQKGHEVVVFEKSRGFGGRAATRRKEGFVWDTGAGYIDEAMLPYLPPEGLVRVDKPVWLYDGGEPKADRPTAPRYTYVGGNNALGKGLAAGLDVRLATRIETLAGLREEFDALILTAPLPQTIELLRTIGEERDLGEARYRSCFAVGLGYVAPLPEQPYVALLARDDPLGWLSLESAKCPGRAPNGGSAFVAQLSEAFTQEHYDAPHEEIAALAAGYVRSLFGLVDPVASDVMRWRYSQPLSTGDFDRANPPGTRILVASDGLTGGKLHLAYEAGVRAAARLDAGGELL